MPLTNSSGISAAVAANEAFLGDINLHIKNAINGLSTGGVANIPSTKGEIKEWMKEQITNDLMKQITINTVSPGISTTAKIASTISSVPNLASLIPHPVVQMPAKIIATGVAVGATAIGTGVTLAKTAQHRARVAHAVEDYFKSNEKAIEEKTKTIFMAKQNTAKPTTRSWASLFPESLTALGDFSTIARYVEPVVDVVGSVVSSIFDGMQAAVDVFSNYKERQEQLINLPENIEKFILPNIDSKKFILFGNSKFDDFLEGYHQANVKGRKFDDWKKDLTPKQVEKFRKDCLAQGVKEDIDQFAKDNKGKTGQDLYVAYFRHKLAQGVSSDVYSSSLSNTLKVASTVSLTSFINLPAGMIATVSTVAIGAVTTGIVAATEKNKSTKRFDELIANGNMRNIVDNIANKYVRVTPPKIDHFRVPPGHGMVVRTEQNRCIATNSWPKSPRSL